MENKVLVVIDMQVDFVSGALGSGDAQAVVEKVTDLVRRYRAENRPVYFTLDTHRAEDYADGTSAETRSIPRHCVAGTGGWELVESLRPYADAENRVEKPDFLSLALPQRMGQRDNLVIELCGVCTDICVVSNALYLRAKYPDAVIRVLADCCAGTTPESHQAALQVMRSCLVEIG